MSTKLDVIEKNITEVTRLCDFLRGLESVRSKDYEKLKHFLGYKVNPSCLLETLNLLNDLKNKYELQEDLKEEMELSFQERQELNLLNSLLGGSK